MENKIPLSKYLKEKRLAAGLSQGDVAKKLGYTSSQFISNWERGLSAPPAETVGTIAIIYGLDPKDLKETYIEIKTAEFKRELTEKMNKNSTPRKAS